MRLKNILIILSIILFFGIVYAFVVFQQRQVVNNNLEKSVKESIKVTNNDLNLGIDDASIKDVAQNKKGIILNKETVDLIVEFKKNACSNGDISLEMLMSHEEVRKEERTYVTCLAMEGRDKTICNFLKHDVDRPWSYRVCSETYELLVNTLFAILDDKEQVDSSNICELYFYDDKYITMDNCVLFFEGISGQSDKCDKITDDILEDACHAFYNKDAKLGFALMSNFEEDFDNDKNIEKMQKVYPALYSKERICDEYYELKKTYCSNFIVSEMSQDEIEKILKKIKAQN